MKNLLISMLLVLALLQSCKPASNNLAPDKTAKEIFTAGELKGFDTMIKLVDSRVIENKSSHSINEAYHAYFEQLNESVADGKMIPALFSDSVKFNLPETIGIEAFSALWKISEWAKTDSIAPAATATKILDLNSGGKYIDYLKETGKSDSLYLSIAGGIENSGDISPSVFGWFLTQHNAFDFSVYKNRLWAAVFIIRLGEPAKRKHSK